MRFKWASLSLNLCASALVALATTASARAELTVNGVSPYQKSGDILYYAAGVSAAVVDSGLGFQNLTLTENSASDTDDSSLITIEVTNTKTFSAAGKQIVLSVYAETTSNTTTTKPIPIAKIDGADCVMNDNCQAQLLSASGYSYMFAARLTNSPLATHRVSFNLQDFCTAHAGFTLQGNGCSSADPNTSIVTAPGSSATPIHLHVYVGVEDATGIALNDANSETKALNLNLQSTQPSFSCPTNMADSYFPGDGEILVNGLAFTQSVSSGAAPVDKLVVVGEKGATVDTTDLFTGGNDVAERIAWGAIDQRVAGFSNSDATTTNDYAIGFVARDMAGVFGVPSNTCTTTGVETVAVEAFLNKNSCFIATATYGSGDAGPVRMLRLFRDRVLTKFEAGRAFVRWYYSWSPGAADWLTDHIWLRGAMLLALTPVQIMAWLALHPVLLLVWVVSSLVAVAFAFGGIAFGRRVPE